MDVKFLLYLRIYLLYLRIPLLYLRISLHIDFYFVPRTAVRASLSVLLMYCHICHAVCMF